MANIAKRYTKRKPKDQKGKYTPIVPWDMPLVYNQIIATKENNNPLLKAYQSFIMIKIKKGYRPMLSIQQ